MSTVIVGDGLIKPWGIWKQEKNESHNVYYEK